MTRMSRGRFLICLGIILIAVGVATAHIFAWVRFPELSNATGDFPDKILSMLLTMIESSRWIDFVIIFLAAMLKYSGIILLLLGSYLWFRDYRRFQRQRLNNKRQIQTDGRGPLVR
jgi:hypothetical protein